MKKIALFTALEKDYPKIWASGFLHKNIFSYVQTSEQIIVKENVFLSHNYRLLILELLLLYIWAECFLTRKKDIYENKPKWS